jgi:hypothetical protein
MVSDFRCQLRFHFNADVNFTSEPSSTKQTITSIQQHKNG